MLAFDRDLRVTIVGGGVKPWVLPSVGDISVLTSVCYRHHRLVFWEERKSGKERGKQWDWGGEGGSAGEGRRGELKEDWRWEK